MFDELIHIAPGSPEIEDIRSRAVGGDGDALKRYVYWSAWQNIRSNRSLPIKKRIKAFRELMKADLIDPVLVHG